MANNKLIKLTQKEITAISGCGNLFCAATVVIGASLTLASIGYTFYKASCRIPSGPQDNYCVKFGYTVMNIGNQILTNHENDIKKVQ